MGTLDLPLQRTHWIVQYYALLLQYSGLHPPIIHNVELVQDTAASTLEWSNKTAMLSTHVVLKFCLI